MNITPFKFSSSKIAYNRSYQALRVDWPPIDNQLEDAACLFGLWQVQDADSVHADYWERHPAGDETLVVIEGKLRLYFDSRYSHLLPVNIGSGMAVIVPAGIWHRLEVIEPGLLLTFTPAEGGELRPVAGEEFTATQ